MTSRLPAAVQEYRLCQHCAERQSGGPEGFEVVGGGACFVCGGLMDRVPAVAREAAARVKRREFRTFAVGVTFPEGVQEREDELRSDLKSRGSETIKTQAARAVALLLGRLARKKVDKLRPDVTVLADFGTGSVSVSSRSLFYFGRYAKPGKVSQRRELCHHCSGAGCPKCRNTGFERRPSVEGEVGRRIGSLCGSERVVFTWLGSEDRESRVYPPGRPFIVEAKNPVKRSLPRGFVARFRGGQVSVTAGRVLRSKPVGLPKFRFVTRIECLAAAKVPEERLAELKKAFRRREVSFDRPHVRPTTKTVYRARAEARGRKVVVEAELDGGLPVKRFVSGELVSPSVSEVLGTELFCRKFDILKVTQVGLLKLG